MTPQFACFDSSSIGNIFRADELWHVVCGMGTWAARGAFVRVLIEVWFGKVRLPI